MLHKRIYDGDSPVRTLKRPRAGHGHTGMALAMKSNSASPTSSNTGNNFQFSMVGSSESSRDLTKRGIIGSSGASRDLSKRFRSSGTLLRERLDGNLSSSTLTSSSSPSFGSASASHGGISRTHISQRNHSSKRSYQQVSDVAGIVPREVSPARPASRSIPPLKRVCTQDLVPTTTTTFSVNASRTDANATYDASSSGRPSMPRTSKMSSSVLSDKQASSATQRSSSAPYERSLCSQFVQELLISTLMGEDSDSD